MILITLQLVTACGGESTTSAPSCTRASAVYGSDDRQDVKDASEPWQSLSKLSVALMPVSRYEALLQGDGDLRPYAASAARGMCLDERFANQPVLADCSGILLEPDVVLTAAHCLPAGRCDDSVFVTGFANLTDEGFTRFDAASAFRCAKVEASSAEHDYALVRLSSPAAASQSLGLMRGTPSAGDAVTLLGYPSGLPLKVHGPAAVMSSAGPTHFGTDLDSFSGDSGAPVFTAAGGLVGMMLAGQVDYDYDAVARCLRPRTAVADAETGAFERVITLQTVLESACNQGLAFACHAFARATDLPRDLPCSSAD